jgi:hypothetical protein
MNTRIQHPIARLAALSLALAFATPAAAQATLSPVKVVTALSSSTSARADEIERRASELVAHVATWRDAAQLYRQAADLRQGDPTAPATYRMSAWLYAGSGNRGLARRMLEKAGEQSAATGDPVTAAHTYIDAAFAAAEDGRTDLVRRLVAKARVLAAADVLSQEQRASIVRRLPTDSAIASR